MSEQHQPDRVPGRADETDGVVEYDNKLPTWWLGIFYFCIAWAGFYLVDYHLVSPRSQAAEYDTEGAGAERWPAPTADAEAAAAAGSPDDAAAGAAVYQTNCVACHAADMTGGIGPSLVDDEWLYGDSLEAITKTIADGVPEKGMLSWGPILGPEEVAQVAAFIHDSAHSGG